jgi:hypothetical protein
MSRQFHELLSRYSSFDRVVVAAYPELSVRAIEGVPFGLEHVLGWRERQESLEAAFRHAGTSLCIEELAHANADSSIREKVGAWQLWASITLVAGMAAEYHWDSNNQNGAGGVLIRTCAWIPGASVDVAAAVVDLLACAREFVNIVHVRSILDVVLSCWQIQLTRLLLYRATSSLSDLQNFDPDGRHFEWHFAEDADLAFAALNEALLRARRDCEKLDSAIGHTSGTLRAIWPGRS